MNEDLTLIQHRPSLTMHCLQLCCTALCAWRVMHIWPVTFQGFPLTVFQFPLESAKGIHFYF